MKFKNSLMALTAMGMLYLSACTSKESAKPVDMAKLKTTIQAQEDAFAAAEKAKDAKAVAAYYSDDAISYSRNTEPTVGKAAIEKRIAERLAKDTSGNYEVYKVVDLFAEGNMVVEIGSWTTMSPAGAELDKGHYMSYFQLRDGKYLCVRDMNVTSMPVKEPAK